MSKIKILLCTTLLANLYLDSVVYGSKSAFAQVADLGFYENAVKSVIPGFRREFCPNLSSADRVICETVPIKVVRNWAFLASASEGGITISAGLGYIFDSLSWGYVLSGDGGNSNDCFYEYFTYYIGIISANTERARHNLPLMPAMSVANFPGQSPECRKNVHYNIALNDPYMREFQLKTVESSISFVLLHEIGHVVKRHVAFEKSSISLQRLREFEMEADVWAMQAASNSKYNISGSMAPFFIGSLQGGTMDWEKNSDHPLGIRRLANFYRMVLDDLIKNPVRRSQLGSHYQDVLDENRELKRRAENCLSVVQSGGDACPDE
ncbi:hypothetical protein [Xanthobacter flavus]|nr:hypothetical protein [Xanthobacter flavus]